MALTKKQLLVKYLNEYTFRSVWNEIGAEYRVNIEMNLYTQRFVTGTVQVGYETVHLPDGQFILYVLPVQLTFGGIDIPSDTWVNASDILSKKQTLIHVYPVTGKMISKNSIYIYKSSDTSRVIVALKKGPLLKILDGMPYTQMYLTIYRDSDMDNDIESWSYYIPAHNASEMITTITDRVYRCKQTNLSGTTIFINGVERDIFKTIEYSPGDYVDILLDQNVVGSYTVDVSNSTTGFYSDKDKLYKEIIHCPKVINPLNRLITHNTCTLYVRRKSTNEGLYLHRCDDYSVTQLTHNDLCVSTSVLDAFRDHLDDQDVVVHVKVRTHSKDNVLMDEMSYLKYLYTCDDSTILGHLKGALDPDLKFWKASELEKSGYMTLMTDTPNKFDEDLLDTYIETFGYLAITALLANHVRYETLDRSEANGFIVAKPYVLQERDTLPLVYLGGKKLRYDYVNHKDVSGGNVAISLKRDLHIPSDTKACISLLETRSPSPYRYTITEDAPMVKVPFLDGVSIYKEYTLDNPVTGYVSKETTSYVKLDPKAGSLILTEVSDGTEVIFGPSLYGSTILVVPSIYTYNTLLNVNDTISEHKPFVIPLIINCKNDTEMNVPLLGWNTVEVYANGSQLIEGLDFTCIPRMEGKGIVYTEIIISALEYFSDEGNNYIEVLAHTGTTVQAEAGYVFDNKISYDNDINIWYPQLSRGYVRGHIIHDPKNDGTYLIPSEVIENGSPYHLSTLIPSVIYDVLEGYSILPDTDRITAINRYFNHQPDPDKEFIIISNSYRIYSPYITAITYDLVNHIWTANNDPDHNLFLKQFSDYDYLKERDPTTIGKYPIDMRYLDISPLYWEDLAPNTSIYRIIRRLASLVLPVDTDELGDTFNG